jgi:hypothetical protein
MVFKNYVTSFVRQWNFVRSETLEILISLSDEQLLFQPTGTDKWQPLYYQFTCIARTQMVYAKAIKEGKMSFNWFESDEFPDKHEIKTKQGLKDLLNKADTMWSAAIVERRRDEDFQIAWPGFKQSLPNHIVSLISHERIHHGELISYLTLGGFVLPKNFKQNWAL